MVGSTSPDTYRTLPPQIHSMSLKLSPPLAVLSFPAALPAPKLNLSPPRPVYVAGEAVTLTCSVTGVSNLSGIRYYKENKEIDSQKLPSPWHSDSHSVWLPGVSRSQAGSYSCAFWKTESGQEIPLERSQLIRIAVTDPLPSPQLTVSPPQPAYIAGEAVTLTCSAAGAPTVSGIRFFKDRQEIYSKELPASSNSHTESLPLLSVSAGSAGQYSCESWETVSGREIKSTRSRPRSIKVTARPPPPSLSLDPPWPIYIRGEHVTLRCSGQLNEEAAGYRFFNQRGEQISSGESSQGTWQINMSDAAASQAYTCLYWRVERGREIPSEKSPPVPVLVTEHPPPPSLSLDPPQPIYIRGEQVTLRCSGQLNEKAAGYRFFNQRGEQISSGVSSQGAWQISTSDSAASQAYTCQYWRVECGREIPSEKSPCVPVLVTGETLFPCWESQAGRNHPWIISLGQAALGRETGEVCVRESGTWLIYLPSPLLSLPARPPPPSLSLDPPHPIYIRGELVTLRCLDQLNEEAAGYRFFNQSGEQISSGVSSQGTWQINTSDAAASQAYTCLYWRVERGREIPSEKSPPVPVSVTDPPPQPELSVDPPSGAVSEGFSLNITCTAPGDTREQRFHFYKDGVKLVPGDLESEISTMEPGTGSLNVSVLSIPWAGPSITGEFTCGYEENVAGRWIPSPRSRAVNVTWNVMVSARDILLRTGGVLLLIAALTALLCYCRRKKRGG
ncbi:immunoglobulin superfamily member 1-like [Pelodiscus sinensis]|uniref:immunoglobulin superfamily member 1-like n=1 Tax=Pelodiscus sinensis TaxID=13735 RepID=UPI003F6AFD09